MQLHRAPTDNDRFGYLARWEALGLDEAMLYVPLDDPGVTFGKATTAGAGPGIGSTTRARAGAGARAGTTVGPDAESFF